MHSLNRVQLIGNLTADPELKELTEGRKVCNFTVATSRSWRNDKGDKTEVSEFHPIVVWGKLAEIAHQYLKKGKKIYVEGRMETNSWEDDQAIKRYKTSVVADNFIMLSPKAPDESPEPAKEVWTEIAQEPVWNGWEAPAETETPPVRTIPESRVSIDDVPF